MVSVEADDYLPLPTRIQTKSVIQILGFRELRRYVMFLFRAEVSQELSWHRAGS